MDQRPPPSSSDVLCPACTRDVVCAECLSAMRRAGIPERTLRWMQLSYLERVESVMF